MYLSLSEYPRYNKSSEQQKVRFRMRQSQIDKAKKEKTIQGLIQEKISKLLNEKINTFYFI